MSENEDEKPITRGCIKALYNYNTALVNYIENVLLQQGTKSVNQFAFGMVGRNANADLLHYWSNEVEARCGVDWDEDVADRFGQTQEEMLTASLKRMLVDITGKTSEEIEEEEAKKAEEARRAMYG